MTQPGTLGSRLTGYLTGRTRYQWVETIYQTFLNTLTVIALAIIVFPLYWAVSTALRQPDQILVGEAPLFPTDPTLYHFVEAIQTQGFSLFYLNSVVVALGVVLVNVVIATLGGYGLARIDIPKKKTFARLILFGYMFPSILLAIPMFIFWRQIGLIDSWTGLIFAETAGALPFSIWVMWQFFQTVPVSLEESAQMAGASKFRAFVEIAIPAAKPGIVAIGIFAFAGSWSAYTIPKIIMLNFEKWPLTVGLSIFTRGTRALWGELMAASILTLVPPFLFIFFLQKYLLGGFKNTGV